MNLSQFETAVGNELGLHTTNEKTTIDDAINVAVQRVLEDTHCYVTSATMAGLSAADSDYTLDAAILEIVMITISSNTEPLERLSVQDLVARRIAAAPSGTPTDFYAVAGANLIMFYPTPSATDTATVYYVPVPAALSVSGDDPSSVTYGGVPAILHEAVFFYACSRLASGDDDQTSGQGQRYRDWYKEEITRYKGIVRKRGGSRNARAVVTGRRRTYPSHDNSLYPAR